MNDLVSAVSEFASATEDKISQLATQQRKLAATVREFETQTPQQIYTKAEREHHAVFQEYLGNIDLGQKRLREFERDTKDVVLATNFLGGIALPKVLSDRIYSRAYTLCPWLDPQILGAQDVSSSDYRAPLGLADASAARVAETATRNATGTPNFRERAPAFAEYYALVSASDHAREDIPRLEDFMVQQGGDQIGAQLGADIHGGSGSGQVLGFTTQTPVTTGDDASPMRNASALQYEPAGAGPALTLRSVENLLSNFKEAYLLDPSFAFMMRPSVWRSLLTGGAVVDAAFLMPRNPSLYGFPVRLTSAMPAATTNTFCIAAGAWKQAYSLVARGPMVIIVNDNITTPGTIKWHIARRFGGTVLNNDAAKLTKFSAT
jgi:HK97 family phage major capsid protein